MNLDSNLKCASCGCGVFELSVEITELESFIGAPCKECGHEITSGDVEKLKGEVGKKLGELLSKRYSKK